MHPSRRCFHPVDRCPEYDPFVEWMNAPKFRGVSRPSSAAQRIAVKNLFSSFTPTNVFPKVLEGCKLPKGQGDMAHQEYLLKKVTRELKESPARDRQRHELADQIETLRRTPITDLVAASPSVDTRSTSPMLRSNNQSHVL